MSRDRILGADPGQKGAIVALDLQGNFVDLVRLKKTEHEIWDWMDDIADRVLFGVLEKVHSMPKQGVATTFTFGSNYGVVRGFFIAAAFRFDLETPVKWQTVMKCKTGGVKKISRAHAQRMFPKQEIINDTADAFILAEYARRLAIERGLIAVQRKTKRTT